MLMFLVVVWRSVFGLGRFSFRIRVRMGRLRGSILDGVKMCGRCVWLGS